MKIDGKAKTAAELRKFGLVMAGAFGLIGGLLLWGERMAGPWLLGLAAAFLLFGLIVPRALGPVERVWMALAHRMSIVSTFILLGLTYFVMITPMALVLRLLGKDRLELKAQPDAATYWIRVDPAGSAARPDKPY